MKKVLAIVLAAAMVLSLAACGAAANATPEQKEAVSEKAAEVKEAVAEKAEDAKAAEAVEEKAEEAASSTEPIKIGIVNQSSGNPVFYDLERGAKETAEKLGVDLQWVAPANADAVQEAALIEQVANTGVQGIGVVPYSETLETTMKSVSDRGIHVAEISGSFIQYDGLDFAVGTDQYKVGHDVGVIAAEKLDPNETYYVSIITDLTAAEVFDMRIDGFYDALDEAGIKHEEVAKLSCDDDTTKAVEAVESHTATNDKFNLWFFAGGWPLMADVSALPNLQKWHEEDGHWCFSVDAFPPMEAFFEAGICDGCSGQYYYKMGELTVQYLVDLINGKELPEPDDVLSHDVKFYSSGSMMIRPENYEEPFSQMTPWN